MHLISTCRRKCLEGKSVIIGGSALAAWRRPAPCARGRGEIPAPGFPLLLQRGAEHEPPELGTNCSRERAPRPLGPGGPAPEHLRALRALLGPRGLPWPHRLPSGGCRGAQRPLAARGRAAAVTARPGTDWGRLWPPPPVFYSVSGRGHGEGTSHKAPNRRHLPGSSSSSGGAAAAAPLPRHLPAAPCGRSASVRGRGRARGRDGAGSAPAGAELPRPRAAVAAPRRAARQPRLPRPAAAAGGRPRVAPRGGAPLAGRMVRGPGGAWGGRVPAGPQGFPRGSRVALSAFSFPAGAR